MIIKQLNNQFLYDNTNNTIMDNNIETLDEKKFVKIFDDNTIFESTKSNINGTQLNDHTIWSIDNFLTANECDTIVNKAEEESFSDIDYRNSQRLIFFDSNNKLINLIESRLDDNILKTINNNNHYNPCGFKSSCVEWAHNNGAINPCIRINKYVDSKGFPFHRDSPFVSSLIVKSNYTLIIYLNDNYDNGETIFRVPDNKYEHIGYTIQEELNIIGNRYKEHVIKPKKGMAIIFDQSIIHMGNSIQNTKYVLRSDLISKGNFMDFYQVSDMEKKLEVLTKKLFRQAQLYELNNINPELCNELYERCISLRQSPNAVTEYPEQLENLIVDIKENISITNNKNALTLLSRNAYKYKYKYNGNGMKILKYATIFAILMQTQNLTNIDATNKMKNIIHSIFDENVNIQSNINIYWKHNFERELEKYCNKTRKSYMMDCLMEEYSFPNNDTDFKCISELGKSFSKAENVSLNKNPIYLNIESTGLKCDDNIRDCFFCGNGSNGKEYDYFINPLFELKYDDFDMKLINVVHKQGLVSGEIEMKVYKCESFNHASCQQDHYFESTGEKRVVTKTVNFDVSFKMSNNKITISCIPNITM